MHTCDQCGSRFTRKYNLTRHKDGRCKHASASVNILHPTTHPQVGQKRSIEIPTYTYPPRIDIPFIEPTSGVEKPPKNPKIQNLLDAIINESPEDQLIPRPTTPQITPLIYQAPPKKILPTFEVKEKPVSTVSRKKVLPPTTKAKKLKLQRKVIEKPQEVDDVLISFTPMKLEAVHGDVPRLRAVDFVTKQPRTKGDIIGYSDESTDDSEDDSMDIEDIHPSIKLLPATVDGLRDRFNELYAEFMREKKHEYRNELVSILDDMLRQGGIAKDEYTRLNNMIAESLDDGKEEEPKEDMKEEELSREEKIKKLIKTTTEYLIEHDKKELVELVNEFRKEEEYIDTVLELEELIEIFLEENFLDGEPIMAKIDETTRKLESSNILKSKQHRLKMLLDDIVQNRHRVETSIKRMMDAYGEKDISDTLKRLAKENLLSEEQYLKLANLQDLDAYKLADVLKETKIGLGLKFLPRKLTDLVNTLGTWLEELAETGSLVLKNKISSVLEELLRRSAITAEKYADIKEDNEIL